MQQINCMGVDTYELAEQSLEKESLISNVVVGF